MGVTITDEDLYAFKGNVSGQVVVITGAANGLGKAAALAFARHGAKLVIGDIDVSGGEQTVARAKELGSDAVFKSCNVMKYEELVQLFEFAVQKFGSVDIVVPNAGIRETGQFLEVRLGKDGLPTPPNLKTQDINLTSVLHTTQLAFYYFKKNKKTDSLKSLVLVGSMASWMGLPIAPIYSAAKHALLGLARSIKMQFEAEGCRIAVVCPWFADTAILPAAFKVIMAGIPMVPVERVAGAVFRAATDKSPETNGAAYTLPDERQVYLIQDTNIDEGVYAMLSDRVKRIRSFVDSIKTCAALTKMFVGSRFFKLVLGAGVGYASYQVAISRGLV
ncbi:NAD-binding protein [Schizopora paradoxa]|uniref:NAD-binding protein n=1 Tax=Schizopora paradoxa TaxID=27342 RepID=A0A0H2S8Q7_9AGAM|nr:NAD-binding protein [Schizopora paradoxa]